MDSFGICERSLRYYQATMNAMLIERKNLQVFIKDGLMYVDFVKAIK